MNAKRLTPILNVSDIQQSFTWHGIGATLRRSVAFAPATHGKRSNNMTFGPDGDECADQGVWMSIWVPDVDAVHER